MPLAKPALPAPPPSGNLPRMNFNYADYFERRTELCGGALVVKGTRVPVRTLLASLAEGATEDEVLADFPTVTHDGLRAVVAFAADGEGGGGSPACTRPGRKL